MSWQCCIINNLCPSNAGKTTSNTKTHWQVLASSFSACNMHGGHGKKYGTEKYKNLCLIAWGWWILQLEVVLSSRRSEHHLSPAQWEALLRLWWCWCPWKIDKGRVPPSLLRVLALAIATCFLNLQKCTLPTTFTSSSFKCSKCSFEVKMGDVVPWLNSQQSPLSAD